VRERLVQALPGLVVAVALGNAAHAWPLCALLVAAFVGLTLIGPRFELDPGRQLLMSAIGAGAGYVATSLLFAPEPGYLSEGWTRLAVALTLAAGARFVIADVRGGYLPAFALMFFGLTMTGKVLDRAYVVFVPLFLLAGLWAFSIRLLPRSAPRSRRRSWVALSLLLISASFCFVGVFGIRKLHVWASQRARLTAYSWKPQVGFSERMDLGALDGLLDSEKRVLRVRGPKVDYLRGAVLDHYEAGGWRRSERAAQESKATFGGDRTGSSVVEITSVSERNARFFLPLGAEQLVTDPASVLVDPLGSIEPQVKQGVVSARFVPGARKRARPAPPGPDDLQLPRRVRLRLEALAREWTMGTVEPAEKLLAIEKKLLDNYAYARAFTRDSRGDPVVDFLFYDKRGHCEYFASALALLARSVGISARVVMGYRVSERSPFGYYVVRERNAHAWVEVWIPGVGWSTHDATPDAELPQNREHDAGYADSSLDALGVAYDFVSDWFGQLSLLQTSAAWLLGSLILALIVARRAGRRVRYLRVAPDEGPLPWIEPLLVRLARAGHARRLHEPLERFAARLPDALPAQLLQRYAALRYGGRGDAEALARDVLACTDSALGGSDEGRKA
jgi:transglutaminase-like putative cysteine protease